MLRYWIWLAERKGLRQSAINLLLDRFSTPQEIYEADARALGAIPLTRREQETLLDKQMKPVDAILGKCEQKHIQVLTLEDRRYPSFLYEIKDRPLVLYYRGRIPELSDRPAIGVVGARRASLYGQVSASCLGYQISRCGAVVVTGLARGIDSKAAEGALKAGGTVIGVLGCGADVVYPPENKGLFADVLQNGCILTEYPPGTEPRAEHFPARNRIISGLSDGVLVVEAGEKSGALITARLALEQGRDVFAVPGCIDNPDCTGSNRLLRSGAILVTCGWDAVQEYECRYPDTITPYYAPQSKEACDSFVQSAKQTPSTEPEDTSEADTIQTLLSTVSPEEGTVLRHLADGEKQLDELINSSKLPAGKVLTVLTLLEVRGIVASLPGKRFRLADK